MRTLSTILIAIVLLFTLSQVKQTVLASDDYQLNLSHIKCLGTYVEIHFVLLNTVDGDVISDLTYTYGTIPPGARTGNVVHFTDNVAPGFYDITSASVWVNSTLVTLHNPGDYAGNYGCQQQPTNTPIIPTNTPTNTQVPPTETPVNTPTNTLIPPTETPVNTPTGTFIPPTETPVNTPTNTLIPPTETPTITPEPTRLTVTPDPTETVSTPVPTGTLLPTDPIVTATFSVPNTGRDNSIFGPGFILTGMTTLGLGVALNTILRKTKPDKQK